MRRSKDIVIPSGNWWAGVTYAPFAWGHILSPAETERPSVSTGTGTILAPTLSNAMLAPKYPGSSIHTGSSLFKSMRDKRSRACCTPETITI
jgi:hypothetical protein